MVIENVTTSQIPQVPCDLSLITIPV